MVREGGPVIGARQHVACRLLSEATGTVASAGWGTAVRVYSQFGTLCQAKACTHQYWWLCTCLPCLPRGAVIPAARWQALPAH